MTEDTEQPKASVSETGPLTPEQGERKSAPAEQEEILQKQAETQDAHELSRADSIGGVGKAESTIRTMQAKKTFDGKCLEDHSVDNLAKTFATLGKTLQRILGGAGMVAATFGALELSKFTTLTAGAAVLEKSPTAVEPVDSKSRHTVQECARSLDVLRDLSASKEDTNKALDRLLASAKDHPQEFITFLQGSYQSVDQEQYHEQNGRTFSTDWALSHSDMKRALEDQSFGKKNALELMQPLVHKGHDVKLGFKDKDQVVLKEYPSQAYNEKPIAENSRVLRRDVLFHTTMSGNDYSMRGVISYDSKGAPYKFFVESQSKNTHVFEPDTINKESDERVALLSSEFQNEFSRYMYGDMGAGTLADYAKPGRELVQQIQVMAELEKRGLTDEAQVAARQIAQEVHRIESGGIVAKGEGQGKGFFDYSTFPERVQQELSKEAPSVDQLLEVANTRGSVVRHQFERDMTAKARAIMSGTEKE